MDYGVWTVGSILSTLRGSQGAHEWSKQKYHVRTNLPLMVSPVFALQRPQNTMKNTIDDADYIINFKSLTLYNQ